ncbi:peptidase M15A, partial [Rhizobium ruizarguesonis]
MQNATLLAMAGLFALQSATGAVGKDMKRHGVHLPKHEARLAYTVQTVSVRAGCFPGRLRAVLSYIAAKTGRRPVITSGHRPH